MLVGQTIGAGAYRFEVDKELGSGAMGAVYRAQFHRDGTVLTVALKVVLLGLAGNEGAMARFEREATILKQLGLDARRLEIPGRKRLDIDHGKAIDAIIA